MKNYPQRERDEEVRDDGDLRLDCIIRRSDTRASEERMHISLMKERARWTCQVHLYKQLVTQ